MRLRKIGVQGTSTIDGEEIRRLEIMLGSTSVHIDLRLGDSAQHVAIALRGLTDEIYRELALENRRIEEEHEKIRVAHG